jgi:hypothetical protein
LVTVVNQQIDRTPQNITAAVVTATASAATIAASSAVVSCNTADVIAGALVTAAAVVTF